MNHAQPQATCLKNPINFTPVQLNRTAKNHFGSLGKEVLATLKSFTF